MTVSSTSFVGIKVAALALLLVAGVACLTWLAPQERLASALVSFGFQYLGWVALLSQRTTRLFWVSPTFAFMLTAFVMVGLGCVGLYLKPDLLTHSLSHGGDLIEMLNRCHWTISASLLAFGLGDFFVRTGAPPIANRPVTLERITPWLWVGFLICMLLFGARIYLQGNFSELVGELFRGELTGGRWRKIWSYSQFHGGNYFGQGYLSFIQYSILPFFSLSLIAILLKHGRRSWALAVITITALSLTLELRREPSMTYFLAVTFLLCHLYPKKMWHVFAATSVSVIAVFLALTMGLGRHAPGTLFSEIGYRVLFSQAQTATYVFDLIPLHQPFARGSIYLQNVLTALPGPGKSFSAVLYEMTHGGESGSASHSSIAEAYANFGVIGALLFAFVLGAAAKRWLSSAHTGDKRGFLSTVGVVYAAAYLMPGLAIGSLIGVLFQLVAITSIIGFLALMGRPRPGSIGK